MARRIFAPRIIIVLIRAVLSVNRPSRYYFTRKELTVNLIIKAINYWFLGILIARVRLQCSDVTGDLIRDIT